MKPRIAALFDAENVGCEAAMAVLEQLKGRGTLQTAMAVGDFSLLTSWMDCARDNGIDLVLQPSLGRGKNSADIAMTIEAMDILQRGKIEAIALITSDRDFTPLALRLRKAGMAVWGFGGAKTATAFRAACGSFEVIGAKPVLSVLSLPALRVVIPPPRVAAQPKPMLLSAEEVMTLRKIAADAFGSQAVHPSRLDVAIKRGAPNLAAKLKGKFVKTLVEEGVVQRVGTGNEQRLRGVG